MDLKNKKIGIWGFGIVGQSAFNYVKKFTNYVQILDQKQHPRVSVIIQTPETIQKFLEENDYIIPSPGIIIHPYQEYHHKFLNELDIFTPEYQGTIIAITGTAGKTTVTDFIAQSIPNSLAAGNIGFAMLDVLNVTPQPKTVVLELSSYQLQYTNNFAPDISTWTNFFANHLDHHKNIGEYFVAKCNILKFQTKDQKSIVPHELFDQISKNIDYQGQMYSYSLKKPNSNTSIPVFYITNNNLVLQKNGSESIIFSNFDQLPKITFQENWIAIISTLYLANQNISSLNFNHHKAQPHRVEYIGNYKNIAVYNDSKSTIQESTLQALKSFSDKKIAVIIGGLSKGANREPLIKYITTQKNITPYIFGGEKEILADLCKKHQLPYFINENLEELLKIFQKHSHQFDVLIFSPAGSSFDQFKNYQERGNIFKELVKNIFH